MGDKPYIGVVSVTFNSARVLPRFLECVRSQSHSRYVVISVDNASKDESVEMLRSLQDERFRLIANPDNRGVAEGNNQGIRAALEAGCSHVLLLNNDVEFGSELFEELLRGLAEYGAQLACPKMMYFDEPNRIWAAGGRFSPLLGYTSVHIGQDEIDHGQYDTASFVKYVPTCCVLIESAVFARVGLMDARYFVYVDDTDFMYRVMKAGLRVIYLPQSRLLHKVGSLTGGEQSPFSVRYGTRNRLFFLIKHFGLPITVPWLVVCQIIWTATYLSRKRDRTWYKIKQGAFLEALRMPRR